MFEPLRTAGGWGAADGAQSLRNSVCVGGGPSMSPKIAFLIMQILWLKEFVLDCGRSFKKLRDGSGMYIGPEAAEHRPIHCVER